MGVNTLLIGLNTDALSQGHAFDLVDEEAVGFDVDLGLELQPGLHQGRVAGLVLGQALLQPVDRLDQVGGLAMELSLHVVNHMFDIRPLFALLNLLLTRGERSLKNKYLIKHKCRLLFDHQLMSIKSRY